MRISQSWWNWSITEGANRKLIVRDRALLCKSCGPPPSATPLHHLHHPVFDWYQLTVRLKTTAAVTIWPTVRTTEAPCNQMKRFLKPKSVAWLIAGINSWRPCVSPLMIACDAAGIGCDIVNGCTRAPRRSVLQRLIAHAAKILSYQALRRKCCTQLFRTHEHRPLMGSSR